MRKTRARSVPFLLPALALFGLAPGGHAQVVPVDEARFELLRGGSVIGMETVSLQRTGIGSEGRVIGQSTIRLQDGTEMRPRLEASAELRATTYQNKFTGPETGEVQVTRAGRRLVARTEMSSGEAQREFPASDQTVLLEDEVVLLYYLLQPWTRGDASTLTVLDPRSSRQIRMQVQRMGPEEVRVGARVMEAEHLRLESGEDVRHVWLDVDGRVMRVEVPATRFTARRLPS